MFRGKVDPKAAITDGRRQRQPVAALGSRLLWFAALWLGGVVAVGAVAFLIRSVLL